MISLLVKRYRNILLCFFTPFIIKITISSIVIGLKNSYFSTYSLAKLLSDSLLLDSLLSDSSIG